MKRIARLVAAATIVAGVGVCGASGTALAGPCEARNTSAPFAPWGDKNQYFRANGGTFEDATSSWITWGGAKVGFGQNPFGYAGHGVRAMSMPAWSVAMSPSICVFENEESLRFSYKAPNAGDVIQVWIEITGSNGTAYTNTYITARNRGWDVSPIIRMPNVRDADGRQWVTIYVMPVGGNGVWQVDDVMIDPWIAR